MNFKRYCVLLLAVAALAGCSHSTGDSVVQGPSKSAAGKAKANKDNKGADPDMVNAVNLAGPSNPVFSMKFKLAARPTVTTPLQVTLQLTPDPDTQIARAQISIQPGEGLVLQSGRTVDLTDFHPGVPVQQDVTVVPQQTGLLNLNATVLVDTGDNQSLTRTYSIPLIVADTHS